MLLTALLQLLPLLLIYSQTAHAAPFNPWQDNASVEFTNFPIKRSDSPEFALHSKRHALRLEQHEEQKRNYFRNILDERHAAEHAEMMGVARGLSSNEVSMATKRDGSVSIGRRAPEDAHSQPMADWFSGGVDLMYTAPMYVGNEPQGMNIVPDTGSSDFWVPWSQSNMAEDHATFDPSNSTTFKETDYMFVQTYGLGRAEGIIGRDTVRMGGFEVTNQVLGVATAVDEQFMRQANDGIMGFASSTTSRYPARNFFENLILASAVPEPYFSVFLTRGRDIQPGKRGIVDGSELCLGCLATVPQGLGTVSGDMHMVPLSTFAFWQVPLDSITLNGKAIPGTSTEIILDTGTTITYLPPSVADAMLAPIGATRLADGSYTVPVANVDMNTRFGFTLGGKVFEMNALDLVNAFTDESRTTYLLTISASPITGTKNEPLGILGDSILKNVISVYHYSYNGAPAVGLQQISPPSSSANPSATAALPTTTSQIPRPTGQFGETGGATLSTIGASNAGAATYAVGSAAAPSAVINATPAGKGDIAGASGSAGGTGQPQASKGAGWRVAGVGGAGSVGIVGVLGIVALGML